jgi:transglutaminase-like putative cysteine protease
LYKTHTSERSPHIVFSEEIESLAKEITHGISSPAEKVKAIYYWINQNIPWASALEYSTFESIPEYVLKYRKGDCGMQTLLFMSLARVSGIPCKWQSGWMLHPGEVNLHDWCEVYYEGVGWVPLDQSFGLQDSEIWK